MKRLYIYISVAFVLLIATLIWGKSTIIYATLNFNGIKVVRLGCFVDQNLSATIIVKKNGKTYNVTICDIELGDFMSSRHISVLRLNGYAVRIKGCNSSANSEVRNTVTSKNIGYLWETTRINFERNSIIDDVFGLHCENIFDFFENIDSVESKLMNLSTVRYQYFTNKLNDEVYIKRVKLTDNSFECIDTSDESNLTFPFKNQDCRCPSSPEAVTKH